VRRWPSSTLHRLGEPRLRGLIALILLCASLAPALAQTPPVEPAAGLSRLQRQGASLLRQRGCLSCHSLDGSPRAAPSFFGLFGSPRQVLTDGTERTVTADEDYLRRAILRPKDDVVVGYLRGQMPTPRLDADEVTALVAALSVLSAPKAAAEPGATKSGRAAELAAIAESQDGSLTLLWISLLAFVGFHFALSARRPRAFLVGALGEKGFLGLYSILAFAALAGIVRGFASAPYVVWWTPPVWARHCALGLMPLALYLLVAGFSTPNPASAGQQAVLSQAEPARGILRITRHPALCGFTLWALLHLLANGDRSGMLTFLAVVILSVGGMLHIDARRDASGGEAWVRFRDKTSRLPFLAILTGRNTLRLTELGLVRPLVTIVLYGAILASHRFLYGVSPLP
jgi:uncharacterized membrane protein/mono/diheme cytochrome c family protein